MQKLSKIVYDLTLVENEPNITVTCHGLSIDSTSNSSFYNFFNINGDDTLVHIFVIDAALVKHVKFIREELPPEDTKLLKFENVRKKDDNEKV